jgi:hypothetical protein
MTFISMRAGSSSSTSGVTCFNPASDIERHLSRLVRCCWWYRKYAPGDTVLEGLEKDARAGWKGL